MTPPARSEPLAAPSHEDRATFTTMEASTAQDWQIIGGQFAAYAARLPDRVLAHLALLEGDCGGFAVDRLTHSLQTATLAHRDGRDEEYVVCALVHDIGDTLGTYNHADIAAAIVKPFVSEENFWMVEKHGIFQGYYFFHHLGLDRNLREQFRGNPHFARAAEFCSKYDGPAFDPRAEALPLHYFEPMLRRVLARPRKSLYVSEKGGMPVRAAEAAMKAVREGTAPAVDPAEWQVRLDLAAAYRLVAHYGWDDLVFTHLSARVPGPDHHFLINPYGMMFDEITASSLVKIDLHGNKVTDSPYPINPAGFTIHSAIHAAREDAQCVLHVHSVNGVAVSAQKRGLLPISQHAMLVLGGLAYHDYEGVALLDDEKPRLVRDLGNKHLLMLRNHGLLTLGRTVSDAFVLLYMLEAACLIQIRAQSGGAELIEIPQRLIDGASSQSKQVTHGQGPGPLAWPALLRKLDRLDPSWRD